MGSKDPFILLIGAIFLMSIAFGMLMADFVSSKPAAPAEVRK